MTGGLRKFYGWLRSGDPLRHRRSLQILLGFTRDILDHHGMTWWLDCGTLLGCVRHHAIIPWDHDLDLGLPLDDLQRLHALMQTAILPDGIEYYWNDRDGYAQFWLGDDYWIDLVGYALEPDRRIWVAQLPPKYRNPDDKSEYYPEYCDSAIFPLGKGSVGGLSCPVPNDTDAVLRLLYGKYRRLDPIPLFFSFLYHPIETAGFTLAYVRPHAG